MDGRMCTRSTSFDSRPLALLNHLAMRCGDGWMLPNQSLSLQAEPPHGLFMRDTLAATPGEPAARFRDGLPFHRRSPARRLWAHCAERRPQDRPWSPAVRPEPRPASRAGKPLAERRQLIGEKLLHLTLDCLHPAHEAPPFTKYISASVSPKGSC